MASKVTCSNCGWSWNKSDSSKKDMYVCHQCGRDNSNKSERWLDKYDDGGTMQEYQENYNDYSVSAPEEMQGDGYNNIGRDYSPAWGGQFEMGGSLPGTVGFTYARTGNIPSNGKYAKKTLASAQKGKSVFKAPDLPEYMKGKESTAITQPSIPLSDVDISRNKFRNTALRAKETKNPIANALEYILAPTVKITKELAKKELSNLGENLDPFGYSMPNETGKVVSAKERILNSGIFGSKEESRKQLEARINADKENPDNQEGMTRTDLLQLYSGRPQQYSKIEPADYVPTAGHKRGEEYVKSKFVEDALIKSILTQSDTTQPIPNLRTKADVQRYIETHGEKALDVKPGAKTRGIVRKVPALGNATLSAGEEGGRPYLSYSDLWDLNPYAGAFADTPEKEQQNWHNQWKKEGVDIATKFAGAKPPKVYGRIYFDPETGRPIQKEDGGEIPYAQNGQEMSYYQHGLDFKTKGMKQGGVVKDDMGYWNPDNYGKVVEIDSPYITMEGVDEPLIGISDEGDKKYMLPGKNYKFKGKKVREYPVAKNGKRQEQKGLINLDDLLNFTNYNIRKAQNGDFLSKGKMETRSGEKMTFAQASQILKKSLAPMVAEKTEYVNSPLYKKRLIGMGEKDPNQVVKDRLQQLKKIQFSSYDPRMNANVKESEPSRTKKMFISNKEGKTIGDYPAISLGVGWTPSSAAHELGHVASSQVDRFVKTPTTGTGETMSPIEAKEFLNLSKAKPEFKKEALALYDKNVRSNISNPYGAIYDTDLGSSYATMKNIDEHSIGSGEAKGDLDAVRYLLKKQGITKKYGEDITPETLKKAQQNKNIQKDEFFQRLKKRFSDEDIIKLNNTIAQNNSSSQELTYAKLGTKLKTKGWLEKYN